jgi:AraC-like DNA-binding protein
MRHLPQKPRRFFDLFEEYGQGSIARLPTHQNGGLELHYISSGHLHWRIEDQVYLVPPRSVFFTFPWEKHGGTSDFEPGHYFHFTVFRLRDSRYLPPKKMRFVPGFSIGEREQEQIFQKLCSAKRRCCPAAPLLASMITRLVDELNNPGPSARIRILGLSHAVLCELAISIENSNQSSVASSNGKEQVLRFIDDLRHRCSEPWDLESMAKACRLGRTRFEALTKEITGDSPVVLINRFRVRWAQQLLKEGQANSTEIAFRVGFNSSQYFSHVFRTLTGTSPSVYRRTHGSTTRYDQHFLKALKRLRSAQC